MLLSLMMLSPEGLTFIQRWEAFAACPYTDSGGVWTIGYGATKGVDDGPVTADTHPISVDQADALLLRDVRHAETAVNVGLKNPVAQNKYDALVSLCYNIGVSAFSGCTALRLVNQGTDPSLAWVAWDHIKGKESLGLERRRLAELKMFKGLVVV